MKNKKLIIAAIAIVLIIVIVVVTVNIIKSKKDSKKITTVTEIELNTKQYINSLVKIKINNSDDYIMVTERVKREVTNYEPGTTISTAVNITYIINVDGTGYTGSYKLNDSSTRSSDKNPKYIFEITDLTTEGEIEIVIMPK